MTILAGVDAGLKMFVPLAGPFAAKEAVDKKARTMLCPMAWNFDAVIRRINISLLPDFPAAKDRSSES
ncbi:MAG TPA: hypothetical protein VLW83_04195 [Candidatus Acidoferrales bacterium]|nr:hypothetical protein [Candidatus Acidoferrales bacterium]